MKLHMNVMLFVILGVTAFGADLPRNTALEGHCPVCLVEMGKQVQGSPEFQSTYDGQLYLFPSGKQQQMFDADPEKYVPAYGGDCVVCEKEMGKAGPGKAEYYSIHNDQLFVFPSSDLKDKFDGNPGRYESVGLGMDGHCPVCLYKGKVVKGLKEHRATYDSHTYYFPSMGAKNAFIADEEKYIPALGGDCVVCKVEMGESVPGKAEFSLVHHERLYLFPGQKQLDMFRSNPDKYKDADLTLAGFCPVCLETSNKLVQGNSEFAATHNGRRYYFPSETQLRTFVADPAYYSRIEVEQKFDSLRQEGAVTKIGDSCGSADCGCVGQ